ncbi:MAG TPA: hypothetical protein VMM79_12400 [Longimicrobiales bacterium]|nr:hypothetical protein [Longimicrobiales bacterium]
MTTTRFATVALAALLAIPSAASGQAQGPTSQELQEQRRALLDMRSQLMDMTRALNRMISALGPATPLPRERPAMMECPWPTAVAQDTAADRGARPAGVIDPPRPRIPDCTPPDWAMPAELTPFTPVPLPEDRPRPLVEDYLKYVVTLPPPEIVERFDLDTTYYRKYADANGYPILASAEVEDAALAIVRDQVNYMLGHRPDIRETLVEYGGRIVIMAETEYTMSIPEQRDWIVPKYLDPRLTEGERSNYYERDGLGFRSAEAYWNVRARGMGGTLTSCAEENVLGYYGTRYWGTNICVHEFSHAIMGAGIGNADPKWFQEIVDAYKAARVACGSDGQPHLRSARGYSGNTFNEYWATGVEWYVGNGGRDRADLRSEDPVLYELISRLIPEDRHLPLRANVAGQSRQAMERKVQETNADWWQREQRRQAEASAARGGGAGRGGRAGGAAQQQTCTPTVR